MSGQLLDDECDDECNKLIGKILAVGNNNKVFFTNKLQQLLADECDDERYYFIGRKKLYCFTRYNIMV